MKRKIILACIIGSFSMAQARTLKEIKDSGVLKIGLREKPTVYLPNSEELQTKIAKYFGKTLSEKLGKELKIEFVVAKSMSELWEDQNQKVRQDDEYTPEFFKKVDVIADVITVNSWRQKKGHAVPFLPIRESFLCNFKESKFTYEKARKDKIALYTVKDSSFHTMFKNEKFEDKDLLFSSDTGKLIPDIEKHNGKACSILDSDFAVYSAQNSKVYFAGPATKDLNKLAWWTSKENKEIIQELDSFWKKNQSEKYWKDEFKATYGLEYGKYISLTGNL